MSRVEAAPADRFRPAWLHLAIALLIVVSAVLLLMPLPELGREIDAAGDLLHAPLFALLAAGVCYAVIGRTARGNGRSAVLVWLGVSLLGVLAEWGQQFSGREASTADAIADVLGAAAGVLWVAPAPSIPWRRMMLAGGVLLLAAASWTPGRILFDSLRQRWQLPVLASFEDPLEMTRWSTQHARLFRDEEHATAGRWGLRAVFDAARSPAVSLKWPARNWTGYRALVFDAASADGEDCDVIIKVQDERDNTRRDERFERTLRLTPRMERIEIPLDEVAATPSGRRMNLGHVSLLQFYLRKPARQTTLCFDHIRLE